MAPRARRAASVRDPARQASWPITQAAPGGHRSFLFVLCDEIAGGFEECCTVITFCRDVFHPFLGKARGRLLPMGEFRRWNHVKRVAMIHGELSRGWRRCIPLRTHRLR